MWSRGSTLFFSWIWKELCRWQVTYAEGHDSRIHNLQLFAAVVAESCLLRPTDVLDALAYWSAPIAKAVFDGMTGLIDAWLVSCLPDVLAQLNGQAPGCSLVHLLLLLRQELEGEDPSPPMSLKARQKECLLKLALLPGVDLYGYSHPEVAGLTPIALCVSHGLCFLMRAWIEHGRITAEGLSTQTSDGKSVLDGCLLYVERDDTFTSSGPVLLQLLSSMMRSPATPHGRTLSLDDVHDMYLPEMLEVWVTQYPEVEQWHAMIPDATKVIENLLSIACRRYMRIPTEDAQRSRPG